MTFNQGNITELFPLTDSIEAADYIERWDDYVNGVTDEKPLRDLRLETRGSLHNVQCQNPNDE